MPASYRREVEYDRNRPSRVNPPEDDFEAALADEVHEVFVNPAHVTVSGPHFVTGINPEALEDRGCANCGEPNVDGVCVLCWDGEDDYRHVLEPENF